MDVTDPGALEALRIGEVGVTMRPDEYACSAVNRIVYHAEESMVNFFHACCAKTGHTWDARMESRVAEYLRAMLLCWTVEKAWQ
eukprot:3252827-Amphidinium_carterae.4